MLVLSGALRHAMHLTGTVSDLINHDFPDYVPDLSGRVDIERKNVEGDFKGYFPDFPVR